MEEIGSRSVFRIWAILGFLAMIVIWFLPWRFQTNDDELMMWLVSGAYTGTPESYAVFIHPLLSWTFSKFYTVFPAIPWYPLTWFGVMYGSYIVFLGLIWKRKSDRIELYCWSLFLFAFLIHFSFFLQFSIVAAFCSSAGLLARVLSSEKRTFRPQFYWTDLLIIGGFFIRFEVPFLILGGVLALNIFLRKRSIWFGALFPLLFLGLSFGLTEAWLQDRGLGDFLEINRLRSQVFDDPVLHLTKANFKNENPDLYFFSNGLIDFQRDSLTIEKLQDWKARLNQDRLSLYQPQYLHKSFWNYLEHHWYFIGIMGLFLVFSYVLFRGKAIYLFLILLAIATMLSPFFLLKIQIYAILFLTFFICCLMILDQNSIPNRKWLLAFSFSLMSLILVHIFSFFQGTVNLTPSDLLEKNLNILNEQGLEHMYLIGSGEIVSDFMFVDRLPFMYLGWPTALEKFLVSGPSGKAGFLVDRQVYNDNHAYFYDFEEIMVNDLDYVLLICE
jgi:hypothetical protein